MHMRARTRTPHARTRPPCMYQLAQAHARPRPALTPAGGLSCSGCVRVRAYAWGLRGLCVCVGRRRPGKPRLRSTAGVAV